jgi:hypothetical protein
MADVISTQNQVFSWFPGSYWRSHTNLRATTGLKDNLLYFRYPHIILVLQVSFA